MSIARWHRLGISIKGNSATAISDCGDQDTRELQRDDKALTSTDGIIIFGQEIDDDAYFDVSIDVEYCHHLHPYPIETHVCLVYTLF